MSRWESWAAWTSPVWPAPVQTGNWYHQFFDRTCKKQCKLFCSSVFIPVLPPEHLCLPSHNLSWAEPVAPSAARLLWLWNLHTCMLQCHVQSMCNLFNNFYLLATGHLWGAWGGFCPFRLESSSGRVSYQLGREHTRQCPPSFVTLFQTYQVDRLIRTWKSFSVGGKVGWLGRSSP